MEGHNFERIIGGNEVDKDNASMELKELHEYKSVKWSQYEIAKTHEDVEKIKKVEKIVNGIVASYGGKESEVSMDDVYVVKPDSVSKVTDGKLKSGLHITMAGKIVAERPQSDFLFQHTIAHEMFHLKSYKSARVIDNYGAGLYRSGLSMIDIKDSEVSPGDETEYFADLEEAIVVECTQKFLALIAHEPENIDDIVAVEQLRDWVVSFYRRRGVAEKEIEDFIMDLMFVPNPQDKVREVISAYPDEEHRAAYASGMFRKLNDKGELYFVGRLRERKKMFSLLDRILESSNGVYKNRDEIFDDFARANFTGNYLPLAKKIEGILGKGSFRKIAEDFAK